MPMPMPIRNWPNSTHSGASKMALIAAPATMIAMSVRKAGLRPKRSAAGPPTAAPNTAPSTSAEPISPTIRELRSKCRVTSGIATPSEKMEKPSSSVPPLARNHSQYCRRPIGAPSRRACLPGRAGAGGGGETGIGD